MEITDLDTVFGKLEGCCLHNPAWRPADVAEVLGGVRRSFGSAWQPVTFGDGFWKEGTDSESAFAVRLKDGAFGLLHESEDYTGHGCQCGAFTGRYADLGALFAACTPEYGPELEGGIRKQISA